MCSFLGGGTQLMKFRTEMHMSVKFQAKENCEDLCAHVNYASCVQLKSGGICLFRLSFY